MKYPHILSRITSTPWAILPSAFDGIARALASDLPAPPAPEREEDKPEGVLDGAIAVIPITGIIGKHLSSMEIECGGCCLDHVKAAFDHVLSMPRVTDVVLAIDSPGGTVPGVPELARYMRTQAAAKGRRLYAFSDTLMASAAYWLATACDLVVATPTANIGSIGVYTAITDMSEAYAKAGVKVQLIKAGKFKDMGHPHRALTEEEAAMLQSRVDAIWEMFKADVTAARPAINPEAMEGQVLMGNQALALGLVDEIAANLDELLAAIHVSRGTVRMAP